METEEQWSTFEARVELKLWSTTVLLSYLIAAWFVLSAEIQLYHMKRAEEKGGNAIRFCYKVTNFPVKVTSSKYDP